MVKQHPADQYIEVRNIRTRYWTAGQGRSSVVLIHGLGGHVEDWTDNISVLAEKRRVFALDMVGFGRTDKPPACYTTIYLMEFVHDFMAALGIRKATLIGESLGGAVALRFASEFPDQVEKLILADAVGFGRELGFSLRVSCLPLLGELATQPGRLRSAFALQQDFENPVLADDDHIQLDFEISRLPGAQSALLTTLRAFANFWGVRPDLYLPVLDRLADIKAPTLIIWGAQDRLLPVAQGRHAAQILPHARLQVFDPCGHIPNMECPEDFNEAVVNFLAN